MPSLDTDFIADLKEENESFFNDEWWNLAALGLEAKKPEWINSKLLEIQKTLVFAKSKSGEILLDKNGEKIVKTTVITKVEVNCFEGKVFDFQERFKDKAVCLLYCLKFKKMTDQAIAIARQRCPFLDFYLAVEAEEKF